MNEWFAEAINNLKKNFFNFDIIFQKTIFNLTLEKICYNFFLYLFYNLKKIIVFNISKLSDKTYLLESSLKIGRNY